MAQEPHLDDRYKNGVFYDRHTGDYCKIVELEDTIGLYEPGFDKPYYTFDEGGYSKEEAIELVNTEMVEVSQEAIEDPVHTVKQVLRHYEDDAIGDITKASEQEVIDLRYAKEQVEIVEK